MTNTIDTQVTAILERVGVAYTASYRGEQSDAIGGARVMDEWQCAFTPTGAKPQTFQFFTGLGLRAKPDATDERQARFDLPGLTTKDIEQRTIYGRHYLAKLETLRKPQAPSAASVLNSLILDSSASAQSFADWASDFGYDTDSRKSLAIYEACQSNGDKLAEVFYGNSEAFASIAELLQDY